MRQVIRFLLTFFVSISILPAIAVYQGKIDYNIPIDYSKLSRAELEEKGEFYYNLALKSYNGKLNNDITSALNLYGILNKKCPNNELYAIKLGTLYDLIGQDRLAKGCFFQAAGINPNKPEAYFYLGEFYYKRALYRRALKYYKHAYANGYSNHYETLHKLGDIHEKLGDTSNALNYLQAASRLDNNEKINLQIKRIENEHKLNRNY